MITQAQTLDYKKTLVGSTLQRRCAAPAGIASTQGAKRIHHTATHPAAAPVPKFQSAHGHTSGSGPAVAPAPKLQSARGHRSGSGGASTKAPKRTQALLPILEVRTPIALAI